MPKSADEHVYLLILFILSVLMLLLLLSLPQNLFGAIAQATSATTDGEPVKFQFWDKDVNGAVDQIVLTVMNKNRREWQLAGEEPYGLRVTSGKDPIAIQGVTLQGGKSNPYVFVTINIKEEDLRGKEFLQVSYTPETGDAGCHESCIKNTGIYELQAFDIEVKLHKKEELTLALAGEGRGFF